MGLPRRYIRNKKCHLDTFARILRTIHKTTISVTKLHDKAIMIDNQIIDNKTKISSKNSQVSSNRIYTLQHIACM